MDTDMGTEAVKYSSLLCLSCPDNTGHALQGQSVKKKAGPEYSQIRDSLYIFSFCRAGTQGSADDNQYHNPDYCSEGVAISAWTLSDGAVYIPLIYFYFSYHHFMGKGSFLRMVMPLWRHA